jgi:Peptidase family M13
VTDYGVISRKLHIQLRTIVAEPIKDDEIEPFKDVKRLYRACINTTLTESLGIAPVKRVIDSLGGWPVVEGASWNEGNWTWQQNMKDSAAAGFNTNSLFTFGLMADPHNNSKRTFYVRWRSDQHAKTDYNEYFPAFPPELHSSQHMEFSLQLGGTIWRRQSAGQ